MRSPEWHALRLLALLALSVPAPRPAQAQETAGVRAGGETARALRLRLEVGAAGLDAEAVRQAIESELGVPVVLVENGAASASLEVRADARRRASAVSINAAGERVERVIELPRDRTQSTESLAWLAGNLARDEAADLIAALRPPAAAPDGAEPAEPAAAEPEKPAPATAPAAPEKPRPAKPDTPPKPPPKFEFDPRRPLNLSVFPPVTLLSAPENRRLVLELGLFYSWVGEIDGAGFNLGVLRTRGPVHGAAAGLVFTQTGPVRGLSLSVGASSLERVSGAQIAVGAAIAKDGVRGLELAVGASVAGGSIDGAQVAVGGTTAGVSVNGGQVSAGGNVAGGVVRGGQLSAGANVAPGGVEGSQIAPVNVAADVRGVQLGIVNVGRDVRGVQLGLVNVARESSGTSIGLVSISRDTRASLLAFTSDKEPVNLALRLVTGHVYTQYGGGYRFAGREAAVEVGIGAHIDLRALYLEPGVHYSHGFGGEGSFDGERWTDFIYRAAVGLELGPIGLFAGGGLRHEIVDPGLYPTYFAGLSLFGAAPEPPEKARGAQR